MVTQETREYQQNQRHKLAEHIAELLDVFTADTGLMVEDISITIHDYRQTSIVVVGDRVYGPIEVRVIL